LCRIAVVTGGNKGIGLEVCRQLASKEVVVVLTARDEKRGTEAARALHASGFSDVVYHNLDVSDPSSAACLADFIENKFGKLDILVRYFFFTRHIDAEAIDNNVFLNKNLWIFQYC
jgi:(+)-neomenthol dehydrogenase